MLAKSGQWNEVGQHKYIKYIKQCNVVAKVLDQEY